MTDSIRLDIQDSVAVITINSPEKLNAVSEAMVDELMDTVRRVEREPAARALIITGTGNSFSSGADLEDWEFVDRPDGTFLGPDLYAFITKKVNPLILRLHALPKPVIAAVNGLAAGFGMSLSLACDIRFAAESARFIQIFARIGLVPDASSTYFLPRLVGLPKALELAWTTEPVPAAQALQLGIVNRVVPDGELLEAARQFATRIAAQPEKSVELIKRGFNQSHELTLERVLEMEAAYQEVAGRTPDFREGVQAFREKRKPVFGKHAEPERS